MKKSVKNISNNKLPFLNGEFSIEDIDNNHKELLGYKVPDGYFSTSKKEILDKVTAKKGKSIWLLSGNLKIMLPIAAAIALLITLTVFKPNALPSIHDIPSIVSDTIKKIKDNNLAEDSFINLSNDVSIASLFVEDDELDDFVDGYVIDQIILEELAIN